MRYGSVCSGIEAATVAWQSLGWSAAWFAEIDPFCCALLRARFPLVDNLGDVCHVGQEHGPIDLLVGGTPCQDFSVNGRRKGMAGFRGKLTGEYLRLVGALRPAWLVWENVVGVLQVGGGTAFLAFLRVLDDCGYGWAWRVLDLVGFGVPQQRRRLFLVGRAGGRYERAGAVLFDPQPGGQHARALREVRRLDQPAPPEDAGPFGWTGDPTPKCCPGYSLTLRASQGGEGAGVGRPGGRVRRFTCREWERLSGFRDDYTAVEIGGRPASDRQRRHALGNTFPVPILRWIGERIDHLEREHGEERIEP